MVTKIIFLKKTLKFVFDKLSYMLPMFLAIFYKAAINSGLSNNNTNGSTMYKHPFGTPGWKHLPLEKVTGDSLFLDNTG